MDTRAAQTFAITVTPVNDAPSFTKGGTRRRSTTRGRRRSTRGRRRSRRGRPNESGQTLAFTITADDHPELFSAGPAVSSTGVLTYTPAVGTAGTATIALVLMDNGGTANGGVDTSAQQTFTITITNPPPVAVDDGSAGVRSRRRRATSRVDVTASITTNDTLHSGALSKFGATTRDDGGAGDGGDGAGRVRDAGARRDVHVHAASELHRHGQLRLPPAQQRRRQRRATVTLKVQDRIVVASAGGAGGACTVAHPAPLATANGLAAPASGKDLMYVESGTYGGAGSA